MQRTRSISFTQITVFILMGIILILYALPYIYLVLTSFKRPTDVLSIPPTLFPERFSFENYLKIGTLPSIPGNLANSLVTALLSTSLTLLLATPAAYAVSRYGTKVGRIFLIVALATCMVPYVSIAIPLFFMMKSLHLMDTQLALAIGHMTISMPLAVWLLASFFEGVPSELEEAAQVDGCSRLGALLKVIIPISWGGISVAAIFSFLASWNDLLFALFLTSVNAKTTPLAIADLNTQFGVEWGTMTALATLFSLPVIIVTFFLQRRIVAGATLGAVKG
ncbi:MAG: carbohydrate ABC transporter permease [Chloroflexota bacterium]|nr:carbohydrate ABC transporter permease [Chloroflexota bacterium]